MRYLELVGTPPDAAPRFVRLVADSPHVEEARLVEWNPSTGDALTALYAITGDADAFEAALGDSSVLVDYEISRVSDDRFYLLAVSRPSEAPVVRQMFESIARMGLIVATPVVYREGQAHVRIVGDTDALQGMVDAVPDAFGLDVREIGTVPDPSTDPVSVLSERQRAAVEAALDLNYYESPRGATHEDVAERLGCAANTATEHLQKAEAKLVRAAMRDPGRRPG
jgi:predicted DNA binding protein